MRTVDTLKSARGGAIPEGNQLQIAAANGDQNVQGNQVDPISQRINLAEVEAEIRILR